MNSMKRQNDRILKEELPRSVGAHYATGDQWRNNSRKNEGMEPKQKQYPVVDVTGDRSKVLAVLVDWKNSGFKSILSTSRQAITASDSIGPGFLIILNFMLQKPG